MPLGALVPALRADEDCGPRRHLPRLSADTDGLAPVKYGFTATDKGSARPAEAHHAGRAFLFSQWRLTSLYGALCCPESPFRVLAVAERLRGGAAAATQRDRPVLLVRLELELVAVGVDQRDGAAHPVGPVLADLDLDALRLGHDRTETSAGASRSPSACRACRP